MEQPHYFYSIDGTDTSGPVNEEELRALIIQKTIGSDSFFCREGETEWRPLDPDVFVRPPGTTRLPPYEPPPYVPPPDARARDLKRVSQLQAGWEEPGPYPNILMVSCWFLAIAGTVVLQKIFRHGDDGLVGYIGSFSVVGALPYFISLLLKPIWRHRFRLVAIVLGAALACYGQTKLDSLSADDTSTLAPSTPPAAGP